jgi:hypothetical protein
MQIDKSQILDLIRQHGQPDQAAQAEQELPDQVDTDQHAGLLSKYGIDIGELLQKFGGKLPGGLGNLGGGGGGLGGMLGGR